MKPEKSQFSLLRRLWPLVMVAAFAVTFLSLAPKSPSAKPRSEKTASKTAATDKISKGMAVITLGGGCFWSMEAIYERLQGVQSAEPGYAGGKTKNPTYEQVGKGDTGHAEAVNVIYDPKKISYGEMVEILLTVLDPTTLNAQGADVGTNYRSVIFYRTPDEKKVAQETIKKIEVKKIWSAPIVTQVAPIDRFYRAEDYHVGYFNANSTAPYCRAVITPKLDKLRENFGDKLKK
ncbi:MAG TPA: peptide-methionine (S)-S-oxide reductase MsrA [Abditibacterium sp.]|jgi:peptide-methionine (S)-S-oxide reductase